MNGVSSEELEAIRQKYGITGVNLDALAGMDFSTLDKSSKSKTDDEEDSKCLCGPNFCEYENVNGQKKHVMQVCCECDDADKCIDACCCSGGQGIDYGLIRRVLITADDRMRIPFPGGAKKIDSGLCLAIILMHSLSLARVVTWAYWGTLFMVLSTPIVAFPALGGLHLLSLALKLRTHFFLTWLVASIVAMVSESRCNDHN